MCMSTFILFFKHFPLSCVAVLFDPPHLDDHVVLVLFTYNRKKFFSPLEPNQVIKHEVQLPASRFWRYHKNTSSHLEHCSYKHKLIRLWQRNRCEDKKKKVASKLESWAVNKISFDFFPACQRADVQPVQDIGLLTNKLRG